MAAEQGERADANPNPSDTYVLSPDICVIGAGSAGLAATTAAVALGVSVVLIEKERMGGSTLNTGCIPSKALIAAARHAQLMREAERFGVRTQSADVDFAAVLAHVREVIASVAPNDSAARLTGLGVTVLHGTARFKNRRTLVVGSLEVQARRFIIATGARPAVPPIENLDEIAYFTSETIFDLRRRPGHLIVVGAGATGLELAQAFRRLGSDVTVLESATALSKDEPELVALLREDLQAEGIDIREHAQIARVARRGRNGVRVTLQEGESTRNVDGTHLLIATGRRPDLNDLGLKEAGIAFDERGIKVSRRLKTRNRRVYAIGDAIDGPQFTHWAAYQARQVVRSAVFRFAGRVNRDLLPCVTFTDPELAHVGLTEAEARRRCRNVQILRWPYAENDRAQAERATRGLIRVLTTPRGRILAADILARNAGELIAPFVLAIDARLHVSRLANAVLAYPTFSEASRQAALTFYTPKLASAATQRLIRIMRGFG